MSGAIYVAPPKRPYTEDEIIKAQELKAYGLSWSAIGTRLGRAGGSISSAVWNYERGKFQAERRRQRTRAVIAAAELGESIPQIVQRYGGNRISIDVLLRYHGFDAKMRREYRRHPVRMVGAP